MKKTGAMILLVILCLLAASFALAENGPVVRGGQFAAYTDGDGRLYLPGRAEPINMRLVNDIVAIDAYRVLFTAANEALALGYAPSELPKLQRVADLYRQATGCTDAEATPRQPASSSAAKISISRFILVEYHVFRQTNRKQFKKRHGSRHESHTPS